MEASARTLATAHASALTSRPRSASKARSSTAPSIALSSSRFCCLGPWAPPPHAAARLPLYFFRQAGTSLAPRRWIPRPRLRDQWCPRCASLWPRRRPVHRPRVRRLGVSCATQRHQSFLMTCRRRACLLPAGGPCHSTWSHFNCCPFDS